MSKTEGYYQGDLRCEIVNKPTGQHLKTDVSKEQGGKGEFIAPTDVVSAALASCILSMLGFVAQRRGIQLKNARVEVEKDMAAPPEQRIGKLAADVYLPKDISLDYRKMLEEAAMACPVKQSLHPDIVITMKFHYLI